MSGKLLIKNGHVVDPATGIDRVCHILIENGRISRIDEDIGNISDCEVIDATNLLVVPGLIDLHTHLREPGFEYKETIKTGTRAAAAGGFTSVCCMANTNPVNDTQAVTRFILNKARTEGVVNVYPVGAITRGCRGKEITEMGDLKDAGCVAFSDDGMPVMDSMVMRRAMEYVKMLDLPIISHCEDINLSADGVMNEGLVSTELGLKGIPSISEDVMVERDIMLAKLTGAKLHIAHVSTAGAVDIIRKAKKEGIHVTAETCPHYLFLTDEAVRGYDTNMKMKPPLRTRKDVEALLEGLQDGTIDIIATDHAPHAREEKEREFDMAPFGIVGLETALSLIMQLVRDGFISLKEMIMKMSTIPARIIGIDRGTIQEGKVADITIIDPEMSWVVRASEFFSKGKNTPFEGWEMKGKAVTTIVEGKVAYKYSEP